MVQNFINKTRKKGSKGEQIALLHPGIKNEETEGYRKEESLSLVRATGRSNDGWAQGETETTEERQMGDSRQLPSLG